VSRLALRSLVIAAAVAALAPAGAHAATKDEGFVASLKKPAVVDGVRLSAKQVKHRFAGRPLYFVLGSREEAAGAVAAFTRPAKRNAYLRETGRSQDRKRSGASASYNGWESVFYEKPFLEGESFSLAHNTGNGNLLALGMPWYRPFENWDNKVSSVKTGYWGARLYDLPSMSTAGGSVDIPGYDSVELWWYFDNVTTSIMNW
jgi:hypothetical protein